MKLNFIKTNDSYVSLDACKVIIVVVTTLIINHDLEQKLVKFNYQHMQNGFTCLFIF
jgi:hypothetical protein